MRSPGCEASPTPHFAPFIIAHPVARIPPSLSLRNSSRLPGLKQAVGRGFLGDAHADRPVDVNGEGGRGVARSAGRRRPITTLSCKRWLRNRATEIVATSSHMNGITTFEPGKRSKQKYVPSASSSPPSLGQTTSLIGSR